MVGEGEYNLNALREIRVTKSFLEMMEMFQSHIFYIFIRKANTNLKLRIFLKR